MGLTCHRVPQNALAPRLMLTSAKAELMGDLEREGENVEHPGIYVDP